MFITKVFVFSLSLSLFSGSVLIAQNEKSDPSGPQPSNAHVSNSNSSTDSTIALFHEYYSRCSPRYGIRCPHKDLAIPSTMVLAFGGEEMGSFYFPFRGKLLSPYGPRHRRMHAGLDIKLQKGDTVKSAFNGVVRLSKRFHGYGLMVVVSHPNGLETLYGHLSKILVEDGQKVASGEAIGLGGRTGRATTTHLHFETRVLGQHFNPLKFIDFDTYSLKADRLMVYNRDGNYQVLAEGEPLEEPLLASEDEVIGTDSTAVVADTTIQVASSNKEIKKIAKTSHKTVYHKVKKGDTLYSIARKNKIPLDELYKMNRLKPGSTLSIGKRLRLN